MKQKSDNERYNEKIDGFITTLNDENMYYDKRQAKQMKRINKKISIYEKFIDALNKKINFDSGRLMGLTDGIFGMVMTLLIFGLNIPDVEITNYTSFISFISNITPTIGITIVSFVLLATFWVYHHEFIRLNRFNFPYLWLNIFFLLCVSFIPFSTSLIGNYAHFFLSEAIFGLNILLTIITFILMYYYANHRGFLETRETKEDKKYTLHTLEMIMGFTIIINLLDYNVSPNFIYLFLLIPVISTTRDLYNKMNS